VCLLVITRILGAPFNPLALTSHPSRSRIRYLPAANPQNIANEVPLTNPATVCSGKPNNSLSQPSTTDSNFPPIGDNTSSAGAWSQKSDNSFTERLAGTTPPDTNPKYLPLILVCTVAGEPKLCNCFKMSSVSVAANLGNSSSKWLRFSNAVAAGNTFRSLPLSK